MGVECSTKMCCYAGPQNVVGLSCFSCSPFSSLSLSCFHRRNDIWGGQLISRPETLEDYGTFCPKVAVQSAWAAGATTPFQRLGSSGAAGGSDGSSGQGVETRESGNGVRQADLSAISPSSGWRFIRGLERRQLNR